MATRNIFPLGLVRINFFRNCMSQLEIFYQLPETLFFSPKNLESQLCIFKRCVLHTEKGKEKHYQPKGRRKGQDVTVTVSYSREKSLTGIFKETNVARWGRSPRPSLLFPSTGAISFASALRSPRWESPEDLPSRLNIEV